MKENMGLKNIRVGWWISSCKFNLFEHCNTGIQRLEIVCECVSGVGVPSPRLRVAHIELRQLRQALAQSGERFGRQLGAVQVQTPQV